MPKVKPREIRKQPSLEWTVGTVKVVGLRDGAPATFEVAAALLGWLAVHQRVDPDDTRFRHLKWRVCHAPSGLFMAGTYAETDAMMIAEHAARALGAAFDFAADDIEVAQRLAKEKLPRWLVDWCRACVKAGKWVAPEPFQCLK